IVYSPFMRDLKQSIKLTLKGETGRVDEKGKIYYIKYDGTIKQFYDDLKKILIDGESVSLQKYLEYLQDKLANPEDFHKDIRETLENSKEISEILQKTKDNLMNIGISGSVFYEIDKFCKLLRKTIQEDLPTKADIVEAIYEWQLKIQK
ncbi:MAG: hypothetical protein KGD64_12325, partial [Candidatus Heimdallarchaeota archaeon]|nr:hypothetical protein [Candidatus Heimdallarchaeota archaeon]